MMKLPSIVLPASILLAGCAETSIQEPTITSTIPGSRTADASSRLLWAAVPTVDHHKHLMGPAIVAITSGQPIRNVITVPPELETLLKKRGELAKDPESLASLYAEKGTVLTESRGGWLTGRRAVADYLSSRFGRAYGLTPVEYRMHGNSAQISGYYTRGETGAPQYIGYFLLALIKGQDGKWLIDAEVPRFPVGAEGRSVTADQLVKQLDEAGVQRAVVLSESFWADGPNIRVDNPYAVVMAENDWTAKEVERFPDRLIGFCSFNPVADHALRELERCALNPTFKGLKFSFAMSGVDLKKVDHVARVRAVFAAANRHRLPMVVHLRSNPGDYTNEHVEIFLQEILPAAPDVSIQIAHLWGGEQFSERALAAFADAVEARRPETRNLYFDIAEITADVSGTASPEAQLALARLIRRIGIKKMVFGSDGMRPDNAWRSLIGNIPLTEAEFRTISASRMPYLR